MQQHKQPSTTCSGEKPSGSDEVEGLSMLGPSLRENPTCDWGNCSRAATKARFWQQAQVWLPVCDGCAKKSE